MLCLMWSVVLRKRLEDIWLSLLHHVVGVTVRCPPASPQAVAGLYYCHSAHRQKIQCRKQRNHDRHVFQSFLLCVCPAFIIKRMRPVSALIRVTLLWPCVWAWRRMDMQTGKCTNKQVIVPVILNTGTSIHMYHIINKQQ